MGSPRLVAYPGTVLKRFLGIHNTLGLEAKLRMVRIMWRILDLHILHNLGTKQEKFLLNSASNM